METKIETIFPTTILRGRLGRDFTENEKFHLMQHEVFSTKNIGNFTSQNTYILEQPEFSDIKKILLDYLNLYLTEICSSDNEALITQSWLNITAYGDYHHRHKHTNSFLSGVLYINVDSEKDSVVFYNDNYNQIELTPRDYNYYNSSKWWFKVSIGDIIIFPSRLSHSVDVVNSERKRISLAFNVIPKGIWGKNEHLNEFKNF